MKIIFAIPADALAIPPNPNTAAMIPTTKNTKAHPNIMSPLPVDTIYSMVMTCTSALNSNVPVMRLSET